MTPDDAAVERAAAAAPNSDAPGAREELCEHAQIDDVELSEDSAGFVRRDLQCRQITASGWIDSLQ